MSQIMWQKLRRDEFSALAATDAVLIQPIGAIEQHGPHLPIDTDSNSVTTVAERAVSRLDPGTALVLPPIVWGLSPYWLPFAGTISLRPETILALFDDIGASVARHGFRRMIVLNGHGGNAGIIGVAATQLARHGIRARAFSYWDLLAGDLTELSPGDFGFIGHAGQTETSIQLHLQPDLVRQELARPELCVSLEDRVSGPLAGVGYSPPDPQREAPNGIYGDAPAGQAEIGQRVIDLAAAQLADVIQAFQKTTIM